MLVFLLERVMLFQAILSGFTQWRIQDFPFAVGGANIKGECQPTIQPNFPETA